MPTAETNNSAAPMIGARTIERFTTASCLTVDTPHARQAGNRNATCDSPKPCGNYSFTRGLLCDDEQSGCVRARDARCARWALGFIRDYQCTLLLKRRGS